MKSSREIMDSLYERRERYYVEQVQKRKAVLKYVAMGASLVLFSVGIITWTRGHIKSGENNVYDNPGISPTYIYVETDRVIYDDFDQLVKNSDLFIKGTVKKAVSTHPTYDDEGRLTYIYTEYELEIEKSLYGDAEKNIITVSQACGYEEKHKQSICFSSMPPFEEGKTYLIFLYYDASKNTYWTTGDYTGRYNYSNIYDDAIESGNLEALFDQMKP